MSFSPQVGFKPFATPPTWLSRKARGDEDKVSHHDEVRTAERFRSRNDSFLGRFGAPKKSPLKTRIVATKIKLKLKLKHQVA